MATGSARSLVDTLVAQHALFFLLARQSQAGQYMHAASRPRIAAEMMPPRTARVRKLKC